MGTDGDVLQQLRAVLDRLVGLDPAALGDGEAVVEGQRQLSRLAAVATRACATFDRRGAWRPRGARSAAGWLASGGWPSTGSSGSSAWGPRRRLFTGADRRAVEVRDRECTHPLCDVPAEDCEVDHVVPFAGGGPTVAGNGRLACGFHNRSRPGAQRPEPPADDERGSP